MTDLNSEAGEQSGVAGPGRLLRRAREQARLSIEDLGAQIKLARGTLDALERDDFATLSEPVYVRGYYRKLSKVLPVTEAELLSAYEKLVAPKLPSPPSKLILAGEQDLGGSRPVGLKMAGGIVLIGVLLGLLAFWGSRRSEETGPASVVTPGVVTPMESAPAPSETPVETPPPAASSAGSALSPEAAVSVDPSRPTAPPAATLTLAPSLAQPPTPGLGSTVPSPNPAPKPAAGHAEVQLQFNATSWTRIEDATGKSLLSGVIQAGDRQTIAGEAPFAIFLGNAPGVSIQFNGQPVDMSQYTKGNNTARFTLP
ncbi:MAG: DUF4115 domain-containing protein [Nevskiaceae bacterium]|nr:MAG: DUF4115 domain-containing protein [Nevskiaceae bacterium]TAM20964.1 MAG: DUF4115 domain-containing protein [Nevskiaceae bacterium]